REAHPALRETVDIRRLVKRLRVVCPDIHVTEVIREKEDDVGSGRFGRGGGVERGERRKYRHEDEEGETFVHAGSDHFFWRRAAGPVVGVTGSGRKSRWRIIHSCIAALSSRS